MALWAPIVVNAKQNILERVKEKYPEATAEKIMITNSDAKTYMLSSLQSYISSVKRIVFYRLELVAELSVGAGYDMLVVAKKKYSAAQPENVLFEWPGTGEWRPLTTVSEYKTSRGRNIRIVSETVTNISSGFCPELSKTEKKANKPSGERPKQKASKAGNNKSQNNYDRSADPILRNINKSSSNYIPQIGRAHV